MKRYLTIFAAIVTVAGLSGCLKKDMTEPETGEFIIRVTPPTKTANNGLATVWTSGDKVNVFHAESGSSEFINDGAFTYTSDNIFTGTLASSLESGDSYDWYVSYPYDADMTSPKKMHIHIPKSQVQAKDGDMSHLCGSLCPLAGKATGIKGEPVVSMSHLVTVMKVKVTNYESSDCNLSTVSFKAAGCGHSMETYSGPAGNLCGNYIVDFTGAKTAYTYYAADDIDLTLPEWEKNGGLDTPISENTGNDEVNPDDSADPDFTRPVVCLTSPKNLGLNESAVVYMACLPFNIPNASFLEVGMNTPDKGIGIRICKEVNCKAGTICSIKQGSRPAPPFKDGINFYHGRKLADGSYIIDNDGWWRCDLPEGFDLQGTFDLRDLFTTVNVDASFSFTASANQNTTVRTYYDRLTACLSGSIWTADEGLDINYSSPSDDRSGIFLNSYVGYQVGTWPIFYREKEEEKDVIVDNESDMYDSYEGLVMAGYQGWHGTPGDGCSHNPEEKWPHYCNVSSQPFIFEPGVLRNCIDFWPDVSEYENTYEATGFTLPDGNTPRLYSSYDESTVNLHFRWMKEYGLDGVFMQRFVAQITNSSALDHSDKVLESAMRASNQYARAISIMYDMVGMGADASATPAAVLADAQALMTRYNLHDRSKGQRYYLYHNGKPLIGVVSVGQPDMPYGIAEAKAVVEGLQNMGFSVMLGVPAYWRNPGTADCINDSAITDLIKSVDIIMPWFVGRYDHDGTSGTYGGSFDNFKSRIGGYAALGGYGGDMYQAKQYGVDYCPLVFAGYSDRNQHPNNTVIKRHEGDFLWKQIYYNLNNGAKMLYVAMFDEIDEGTAIYKCLRQNEVPSNTYGSSYYVVFENGAYRRSSTAVSGLTGNDWCKSAEELGVTFNGIENNLDSDHYLWLTGQAAAALKGKITLTETRPTR